MLNGTALCIEVCRRQTSMHTLHQHASDRSQTSYNERRTTKCDTRNVSVRKRVDRQRVEHEGCTYALEPHAHCILRVPAAVDGGSPKVVAGQKGVPGLKDGAPGVSRLRQPSTLSLSPDASSILVCDDGNGVLRRLDLSSHTLTTLAGNSAERIQKTWMTAGEGLAPSLRCPAGSVSIVKTERDAVWSTAFAPLPPAPEGGDAQRLSWCVVVEKASRFGVRAGVASLLGSIQVRLSLCPCEGCGETQRDLKQKPSPSA